MAALNIDAMQVRDWAKVRTIFGEGLATGLAAFRLIPPVWKDWNAGHLAFGRLVARRAACRDPAAGRSNTPGRDDRILGWGALAPVADS